MAASGRRLAESDDRQQRRHNRCVEFATAQEEHPKRHQEIVQDRHHRAHRVRLLDAVDRFFDNMTPELALAWANAD